MVIKIFSLKSNISQQFIKFCLVGTLGASLTYLIFFTFYHYFKINYIISSASGFLIPTMVSFLLNKTITFKKKGFKNRVWKYYLVSLISTGLGLFFLRFSVEFLYINPYISNIFAMGISTISNFSGNKLFVFRDKKEDEIQTINNSTSL